MYCISDAPPNRTAYIGVGGNFQQGAVQESIRAQWKKSYVNRQRFPLPGSLNADAVSDSQRSSVVSAFPTGRIPASEIRYLDASRSDEYSFTPVPSISSTPVVAHDNSSPQQSLPVPTVQSLPVPFAPVQSYDPPPAPSPAIPPTSATLDVEPDLQTRTLRESNEIYRWWQVSGQELISAPPAGLEVHLADLYVYRARSTNKIYTWVYREDGWHRILPGYRHPVLADRMLWWRSNDEPSWVTAHTYSTYRSRYRSDWKKKFPNHDMP